MGAIIAVLVGAWLLPRVIIINGIGDINVYGVPILRALVGAILLVAIWQLLTAGLGRGHNRASRAEALPPQRLLVCQVIDERSIW